MSDSAKASGQRSADVARADDTDLHARTDTPHPAPDSQSPARSFDDRYAHPLLAQVTNQLNVGALGATGAVRGLDKWPTELALVRLQTNAGTVFERISLDNLSPDEHRARYFEMKAAAREREAASDRLGAATVQGPPLPADAIVLRESIPYGWYWTGTLSRGDVLRIVNTSGTCGVSAMFWNADDTSERYNAGDTVKVQWNALLRAGRVLLSDMGRVLLSLTADMSGRHDTLVGGSTPASNAAKYGDRYLRNTRDNLLLAAGKHGLTKRDIAPCVTFFAPVVATDDGRLTWSSGDAAAGCYVDLRAEMNVLVALSNCHHPLAPGSSPTGAVEAIVWRGPAADAADLCRTSGPEAIRAYQNTDALFRA